MLGVVQGKFVDKIGTREKGIKLEEGERKFFGQEQLKSHFRIKN